MGRIPQKKNSPRETPWAVLCYVIARRCAERSVEAISCILDSFLRRFFQHLEVIASLAMTSSLLDYWKFSGSPTVHAAIQVTDIGITQELQIHHGNRAAMTGFAHCDNGCGLISRQRCQIGG